MSARKKRSTKEEVDDAPEKTAPRSFWSGTITFGLVGIPVDFYPATRSNSSGLRLITKEGQPVGKRYVCPRHERPLSDEEIVRGFEMDSGEFVVVSDEDLESVAPEKTRDIDLKRFVSREELPVLLFSRAYVLAPSGGSNKAYRLLAETMEQSDHAGIATFVMRDKAYMVAILAESGVMRAEVLRFADEIRTPEIIGLPKPPRVSQARTKEMLASIDKLVRDELDLNELRNQHEVDLAKLVKDKLKRGQNVFETSTDAEGEKGFFTESSIDLVALLKQRLEGSASKKSAEKSSGTKSSSRAENRTSGGAADLEQNTKSALYERAKSLGIDGRSTMNKKDLAVAIEKAAG